MNEAPLLGLTANIVSAYLRRHAAEGEALSSLIQSVYQTLASAGSEPEPASTARSPAVPIKKSVFPDYVVCLEDGQKLKMLKRYLKTRYGMTPEEYRAKWGLPRDYPMVAPNYTAKRSALAKSFGLGRASGQGRAPEQVGQAPVEAKVTVDKARRVRGSKGRSKPATGL